MQHVEQLRQLVQLAAAQQPADGGDAGRAEGDLTAQLAASWIMVRNLSTRNGRPQRPMRCWRNNTGPGEVIRTASATAAIKGEMTISPMPARITSIKRFSMESLFSSRRDACSTVCRRGACPT